MTSGLRRAGRCLLPILAVVAASGLSGCAGISQKFAATASQMPAIGLPADAPARPAVEGAYPAVHDMPAARTDVMLTDVEQEKLTEDLTEARDRQQRAVGLPPIARKTKAKAPPTRVVPVSSSQSIY